MAGMDIQLVIKAPDQNVDDHIVHCNLEWTVGRLKDHLSQAYPNKPVVKEQKLIYSGRLLHDHLLLKDILRHEEGQGSIHILHLVCNSAASQEQHTSSSQNWNSQATPSSPTGPSENVLRHRNVSAMPPINSTYPQYSQGPGSARSTNMPVFFPDSQIAAQIAAMQQMYAYYFTQYIQSINPTPDTTSAPIFPDITQYQPQGVPNGVPNDVPNDQRQVNQRLNAQGGPLLEENDEMGNRDWLDHLFLCCRFLVLFCVVYFYSTPERLMIVIVCAIIAFLYHEGWFVRRANPAAPAEVHPARANTNNHNLDIPPDFENNENDPSLVHQDFSANEESHDEHELEAAMDGDDPPHAHHADVVNNNHIFSPLTFLTTFFSSLIPDPPPPVNIN